MCIPDWLGCGADPNTSLRSRKEWLRHLRELVANHPVVAAIIGPLLKRFVLGGRRMDFGTRVFPSIFDESAGASFRQLELSPPGRSARRVRR